LARLWLVGNKVRDEQEAEFIESESPGIPVLGVLPATLAVQEADRLGEAVYDYVPEIKAAGLRIAKSINQLIEKQQTGKSA